MLQTKVNIWDTCGSVGVNYFNRLEITLVLCYSYYRLMLVGAGDVWIFCVDSLAPIGSSLPVFPGVKNTMSTDRQHRTRRIDTAAKKQQYKGQKQRGFTG
jgi:hypothetical protein